MRDLELTNGMGELVLDGLNVGAVYYELDRQKPDATNPSGGLLTGEPHLLKRAYREGDATLVLHDGHRLPITVTRIMEDEGAAVVHLRTDEKAPPG